MPVPALRRDGPDWLLSVRVQPRAARTEFAGMQADRLRVRLNAPPVDGRANAALIEFVAAACGVSKSRVTLEHGSTGREKCLRVHGLAEIPAALQCAIAGTPDVG
jgi:uncharacterized protein (TIGR00251 family)